MQVSDDNLIHDLCVRVITANPKLVEDYKTKGKSKHFNKIVALVKTSVTEKIDMKKVSETVLKLVNEKK